MNKRVYNKAFGKIVRTLGFLLVLASSVFIAVNLILENDTLPFIGTLIPFAEMINDIIATLPFIAEFAGLALIVGLIFIVWAIRRGVVLRVVLTVLLLFVFIESTISGTTPFAPIVLASPAFLATVLPLVQGPIEMVSDISEYIVPGAAVAAPILLWAVFAYKKPGRLSIFMLRVGATLLFLAIAMFIVANLFVQSLLAVDIYQTIRVVLYIVTYLLFVLGGVFGVLGFARK
jgi:hypothetical protein